MDQRNLKHIVLAAIMAFLLQMGNQTWARQSDQSPDGRVNSENVPLRLRAGPGLDFAVLDLLPDGTPLAITGRNTDASWLEVRTLDQYRSGWVYADYVTAFINVDNLPENIGPLNFAGLISGISDHSRQIYRRGQAIGRRANVFAKVGDSITASYHMFQPIGEQHYALDAFDYLQPAIEYFASAEVGQGNNAFTHQSVAAGVGWTAAAALLPNFADPAQCLPGETPLVCEYRLINPAFALIMFGTNDVGYVPENDYQHNLERLVQISIDAGVVPVLSTIPPRVGYDEQVVRFNQIIRDIALQHDIPLWDYHYAMAAYRQTSLTFDGVHPSLPARGHDDVAVFKPDNLPYGYVLRNLSALHVLDALWKDVVLEAAP